MLSLQNNATRNIVILLSVIAWGLTIALVYNLLNGTFESGRTCQTSCVQNLYVAAALIALIGTVYSFLVRSKGGWIGVIALGTLVAIFATTMFVGTFL